MIPALVIILGCQLAGEVISRGLALPLPGPVLGMVFLVLGLGLWPALRDAVRPTAMGLLSHLSLLFVPAGVGVVAHLDLLTAQGPALALALIVSTLAAIAVGALTFKALARWMGQGWEEARDE
ncbi:MAG TPA: CidA/LrgA family protein [Rhodobacteraceae bacterium]|jgi:holin-like protein|nr:CidA/LrgA family protein [Paracoccaceae bacterium]